jgi:hypothetical protein
MMNGSEHDYFVIVTRRGRLWSWEVLRRSKPLGVRFRGDEFATSSAAKDAGQKALKEFLDGLARDHLRLGEQVATHRSSDTGRLKSAKFADLSPAIPAEDRNSRY